MVSWLPLENADKGYRDLLVIVANHNKQTAIPYADVTKICIKMK